MLGGIGIEAPELLVFNQIDRMADGEGEALARRYEGVAVSALRRTGLRSLLERAERMLWTEDDARPDRPDGLIGLAGIPGPGSPQ